MKSSAPAIVVLLRKSLKASEKLETVLSEVEKMKRNYKKLQERFRFVLQDNRLLRNRVKELEKLERGSR